uniref:Uncharacterized protein n=1 Tax=Glossina pallidipes TaxID=7398 RepID=A0A1B0AGI4_GLOPL
MRSEAIKEYLSEFTSITAVRQRDYVAYAGDDDDDDELKLKLKLMLMRIYTYLHYLHFILVCALISKTNIMLQLMRILLSEKLMNDSKLKVYDNLFFLYETKQPSGDFLTGLSSCMISKWASHHDKSCRENSELKSVTVRYLLVDLQYLLSFHLFFFFVKQKRDIY